MAIKNVVIGGGTGAIGRILTARLRENGFNVRIISRYPLAKTDFTWKAVESVGLPEDTNIVINLSGRSIFDLSPKLMFGSAYRKYLKEVRSSRIKTTELLVRSLPQATTKFVSTSAIGFYRPDLWRTVTEETPYEDHDFLTRLCRDWEAAAYAPNLRDVQAIQVRIGVVLNKAAGLLPTLAPSHQFGLGGPIGSGKQWLSWIHIEDLVRLFCFIITSKQVLSGPVNGTAPFPTRQAAFARALGESLGAPVTCRVPTPAFVLRLLMGSERAVLAVEGQRVVPKRAIDLGFQFKFPTLELALEDIYGKRPTSVPTD